MGYLFSSKIGKLDISVLYISVYTILWLTAAPRSRGRVMKNSSKNRAFTLLELLVAIAIVAILAGVVIPNYFRYVKRAAYSEIIMAADPYKVRVLLCISKTGSATNCKAGSHGIPPDYTASSTASVEKVSIGSGGVITVTPGEVNGTSLSAATYVLTPKVHGSKVTWDIGGGVCAPEYSDYIDFECGVGEVDQAAAEQAAADKVAADMAKAAADNALADAENDVNSAELAAFDIATGIKNLLQQADVPADFQPDIGTVANITFPKSKMSLTTSDEESYEGTLTIMQGGHYKISYNYNLVISGVEKTYYMTYEYDGGHNLVKRTQDAVDKNGNHWIYVTTPGPGSSYITDMEQRDNKGKITDTYYGNNLGHSFYDDEKSLGKFVYDSFIAKEREEKVQEGQDKIKQGMLYKQKVTLQEAIQDWKVAADNYQATANDWKIVADELVGVVNSTSTDISQLNEDIEDKKVEEASKKKVAESAQKNAEAAKQKVDVLNAEAASKTKIIEGETYMQTYKSQNDAPDSLEATYNSVVTGGGDLDNLYSSYQVSAPRDIIADCKSSQSSLCLQGSLDALFLTNQYSLMATELVKDAFLVPNKKSIEDLLDKYPGKYQCNSSGCFYYEYDGY